MSGRFHRGLVVCVVAVSFIAAEPATAHLDLLSPTNRYGGRVLKDGPCGQPNGARSANVTTFRPGQTIEVRWDEYIDHPGHFRVSFDDDGDDDFVDPRCTAGCNSRSPTIERNSNQTVLLDGIVDTRGGQSSIMVTLPDVECRGCTLQVIQVMYDKPPYTLPGDDIYYQCADLQLIREPRADAGAPPDAMDDIADARAPPSPDAALVGDASEVLDGGMELQPDATGDASLALRPPAKAREVGGGCSAATVRGPPGCSRATMLLVGLTLVVLAHRRTSRSARKNA